MNDPVKYPRTFHLPWSEGSTNDDRFMPNTDAFIGKEVIVTEKMDGENTTMYSGHIHARSLNTVGHESRNWVRAFHDSIRNDIPAGWRICGENVYAKHSIHYVQLESYFLGFSIWDKDICLSWDETADWFEAIGIKHVPILWRGKYDNDIHNCIKNIIDWSYYQVEGYVVRVADRFSMNDFSTHVGKFVFKEFADRIGDEHWMSKPIIPNLLSKI